MNNTIDYVSIHDLIKNNEIIIPEFQRIINNNKIKEIVDYQLSYKKKHNCFNFLGTLIFCKLQDKTNNSIIYYLIDGQHRYESMKKLVHDYSHEFPVYIQSICVNNIEEMRHHYSIINKNTPLPELSYEIIDKDKQILQDVYDYFQEKYPKDIWSYKLRTHRPRIFVNAFQETIMYIYNNLKNIIHKPSILIQIIEDYNNILSERNIESFVKVSPSMFETAQKWNFYLGLYTYKHEQDYCFDWAKQIVEYKTGTKIKNISKPRKKRNISKSLSDAVWVKYMGQDSARAYCLICNNNIISRFSGNNKFHCGHIQSEANGGSINIDNLLPICSTCNTSMGTTHMDDYVKSQFPNNWNNYTNRNYKVPNTTHEVKQFNQNKKSSIFSGKYWNKP